MTTACIIAAVCILVAGLFAVIVERTNERDEARESAERAERRAEVFADEIVHSHAANEILCAELAASDAKIRRLSNDLLAAQMRLSDGVVVPLVRDDAEPTWPEITRQIQHDDLTALMGAVEED